MIKQLTVYNKFPNTYLFLMHSRMTNCFLQYGPQNNFSQIAKILEVSIIIHTVTLIGFQILSLMTLKQIYNERII